MTQEQKEEIRNYFREQMDSHEEKKNAPITSYIGVTRECGYRDGMISLFGKLDDMFNITERKNDSNDGMTMKKEISLEERQVIALERIAESLSKLSDCVQLKGFSGPKAFNVI